PLLPLLLLLLLLLLPAAGCALLSGQDPAATAAHAAEPAATAPAAAAAAPPALSPQAEPSAEAKSALNKAESLWKTGRREQARLAFSRALHLCPDCLEGQRDLVDLLLEESQPAEAAAFLRDRLEAAGRSSGPLFGLAYALARGGALEGMREAAQLLEEARLAQPERTLLVLTLAEVHAALDDRPRAAGLYGQAITALRAADSWEEEARANIRRAQLLHLQGDEQARGAYEEAISRALVRGDRQQETLARNGLGGLLFTLGEVEGAQASFTAALAAADAGQDQQGAAAALQNLAMVHEELWQDREALERLRELVERLDAAKKPAEAAVARLRAGELMGRVGLVEEAVKALQAALEAFQQQDAWGSVADTLVALGRVFRRNDRPKDAGKVLEQALEVRQTLAELLDDWRPVAEVLLELGTLQGETGGKDAVPLLTRALELSRQAGEQEMIARSARALGFALLRQGKLDALPPLLDALRSAGEDEPFLAAQLAAAQDDLERAILLGEAAVDPVLRLSPGELMERYGFLLHLYLSRGQGAADLRQAFALAVAGRAARTLEQLQEMRVRIARGIPAAQLQEGMRLSAQEEGMGRLVSGAGSASVERVWRRRRAEQRRRIAAWEEQLSRTAPAWAQLHFPAVARRAALAIELPADEVHIHPLLSTAGAVVFLLGGGELETVAIKGTPSREALIKKVKELVGQRSAGAKRVVLSPPPGSQASDWGLPLAPSPLVPVLAPLPPSPPAAARPAPLAPPEAEAAPVAAAGAAAGAVAGIGPAGGAGTVRLELLAPLASVFATDYTGQVVEVSLTGQLLARGADGAVELLAWAALYSGAREVRYLLPRGGSLVYSAR
ncbi:MAG: tetratricopeptide repeat protein, partial [Deltaproteobacteria bacterium]|nr:tetratricopeptide repeat protein [Deltaproteobacteria bacterium]